MGSIGDGELVTHWARRGSTGWWAVAAGILVWDLTASEGETLSESFRRGATTKTGKVAVGTVCGLVMAHLFEVLPKRYDPLHGIHVARDRMYRTPMEVCGTQP
jgi:hypothetical protein